MLCLVSSGMACNLAVGVDESAWHLSTSRALPVSGRVPIAQGQMTRRKSRWRRGFKEALCEVPGPSYIALPAAPCLGAWMLVS